MTTIARLLATASVAAIAALGGIAQASAADAGPQTVKLAWTHYAGWEPWGYIQDKGIAQRAIEASCGAGSKITISLLNDYSESLTQYTAGAFDGVAATNMDALTVPGVGGRKTDMLVVSDYSNGNDAVISGDPKVADLKALKGRHVKIEALTVSQYLLARGLEGVGLSERDLTLDNVSDADIGGAYAPGKDSIVVTWNPIVRAIMNSDAKAKELFTSASIPGEIVDAMVTRSDLAPCAKSAIRKAWFDTVAKLAAGDPAMIADLAAQAGGKVEDYEAQLKTTHLFRTPAEADAFVRSVELQRTMKYVRDFTFEHGMFGQEKSASSIGIRFPDGKVLGDANAVMIAYVGQADGE